MNDLSQNERIEQIQMKLKALAQSEHNDTLLHEVFDLIQSLDHPDQLDLTDIFSHQYAEAVAFDEEEQDDVFDAIWSTTQQSAPSRPPTAQTIWFKRIRSSHVWVAIALCALSAALIYHQYPSKQVTERHRFKHLTTRPQVELFAFEGQIKQGKPTVVNPLLIDDTLPAHSHVVFRYKLAEPCWIVLLGQQKGSTPEILWQSTRAVHAGESEIESNGQLLSLPVSHYRGPFKLALVALRTPPTDRLDELPAMTTQSIHQRCQDCAVASFSLIASERP